MDNRAIGLKITRLRERKGLTTTQLAERVGISQAQISRLENGKQGFRSATLGKIATALDVKPIFFFNDGTTEGNGLSPQLAEALKATDFSAFAERAAGAYLKAPGILLRLNETIE